MFRRHPSQWIARRRLIAAVPVALLTTGLVACGSGSQSETQHTGAEGPFLAAMVPHHQSAVEMARVAERRAEHPEVRRLATSIVATQNREIGQMRRLYQRSFGTALRPDPMGHEALGLSADAAGMSRMGGAGMLNDARPFDRAFIDMMIPHHQGAIRMARAVLARRPDAGVRSLANAIITAQSREIAEMNAWRTRWYGGPSLAGGVPAGDQPTSGRGMHAG